MCRCTGASASWCSKLALGMNTIPADPPMVSNEGLPAVVAPAAVEPGALRETALVGVPEPRAAPVGEAGRQQLGVVEGRVLSVDHDVLRADKGHIRVRLAHELLAVQAVAVEPLHGDPGLHLEAVGAAGARASNHG